MKSPEALKDLVGPVALYPDDLLSVVLAASVYPLQIVQAARFLEDVEDNPELTPRDDWDESVLALLSFPDVVRQLSDDLDWTWELGQAVLNQQEELIAAASRFREAAHGAGNLRSDERQRVGVADAGVIEIHPANPQVIYVPCYEPSYVRVYHSSPVIHYYPRAYPVYYYPYPADHYFASGRPYYPGYRYGTPRRPIVHHHYQRYTLMGCATQKICKSTIWLGFSEVGRSRRHQSQPDYGGLPPRHILS